MVFRTWVILVESRTLIIKMQTS